MSQLHPLVAYLTTFSAKLILDVMVTKCCSLLNAGYRNSCVLLSCSVSGGDKGDRKASRENGKGGQRIKTATKP